MRPLLAFLLLTLLLTAGCGAPVTAPATPEGCTYVTTVTADNGVILTFTSYLPADHPLCQ
jgi:hypothetical protein